MLLSNTPEHRAWRNMKERCYNIRAPNYKYYGRRGITVDKYWRVSFERFLQDVGPRPGPGYSLDRIDTNGNYVPGNVRWATEEEQLVNKDRPKLNEEDVITIQSAPSIVTGPMLADLLGITRQTVNNWRKKSVDVRSQPR